MLNLARLRGRHLFVVDLVVVLLAIASALILRFDTFRLDRSVFLYFPAALLPLLIRPPLNMAAGLYSRAWAYASVGEMARIAVTVLAGSVAITAVMYFVLVPLGLPGTATEAGRFPRSFFVLEGLLTLAGYGGVRFLIRAQQEWAGFGRGLPGSAPGDGTGGARPGRMPTLVYGAGTIGATVLRTIATAPDGLGMRVVGLIDDDRARRNQVLRGAKVLGSISELEEIARVTGARRLLIAIPRASGDVVRGAVERATALGLETRTVPAFAELVTGRLQAAAIREVQVDDLLRRAAVHVEDTALRELVAGKTVLVTGAGGSIGSELARQVFDLDPAVLVLLDRSEGALYEIERELTLLAGRDGGTDVRAGRPRARLVTRLANVASLPAMSRILAEDRPALVFHAAAYKHVPMMELHPADAVYTNIGGTLTALRASLEAGVERFVLVSTDKAVEPSSIMGASKRMAELAVEAVARETGQRFVAVRFGNVLGSSGSVVPLFQRQLREGVPLTITHPEMTRYFMTIPEASRLILQASLIGEPGDLFVLDMGQPVKIVDLALDLARLAGRDPASVPIEYVGLRPGEKLHETLFYSSETAEPTSHPKVLRTRRHEARAGMARTLAVMDRLVAIGATSDHEAARAALLDAVAELDPDGLRGLRPGTPEPAPAGAQPSAAQPSPARPASAAVPTPTAAARPGS